jgi:hypothetical protein
MSIPTSTIYVRPGAASYTWSYSGTTSESGAAVTAVAFDIAGAAGQQLTRGDLQYSLDAGRSWTTYAVPVDQAGAWLPAAGTLWRFVDKSAGDNTTPGSFTAQMQLADNSVVALDAALVVDLQPVGLVDDRGTVLSTLHAGETVATLNPIDTGALLGGRWVIDSQSQPGLFAVGPVDADGAGTLVIANPAAMPAADMGATVTMHYYDRYQLDANGNPLPNTGVTDILTYTVVNGASADLKLGTASIAAAGQPALATLSDGGFVAAWQGPVQGGVGVWMQVRDAAGAARGAPFAIASGVGAIDGEPAVTALAGGRFVLAYSVNDGAAGHIAYRIVGVDGSVGAEQLAGAAAPDAGMPALAALADGSFVLAWRADGAVHTQQVDAGGAPLGAEHVVGALGSAFNPAVAALKGGSYVVSWGEIADGNVYTAMGSSGAPQLVTFDGAAASIATAAPLPHMAALAGGGFVVAWDSYSNDTRAFSLSDIFFQRYDDAGNKVGDIVQANLDSGSGRYDAAVAALSDGGFVITWQANAEFDGSGVFGRRFGADGQSADLHEFEINQLRQGDQASPAVTGLANGGFVTAWVDTQDATGASVEARVLDGGVVTAQSSTSQSGGSGAAIGAPAPPHVATGIPAPAQVVTGSTTPVPTVTGSAADNAISLGSGSHLVDGGAGLDTVLLGGARAGYTLTHDANGFTLADASGAHNQLANVERIGFTDSAVALDIAGVGGQAYRLYQAAFDRQPDKMGLGYWIKALDGGATLDQVAAGFAGSKEFADLYGANPSDTQFTDLLYQNVLHRAPDAGGYAYWLAALGEQHLARTGMLVFFSESAENQAQVIGSIGNGIDFIPWG